MVMVQRTTLPTPDILERHWHVVDATGQHLGRLATEVANLLRGKHKPYFVTFQDTGDFVVVINAEKVVVTGKKATQKFYRRTSGRPGGMKFEMYSDLQKRIPERILEKAIGGMLPHTRLGRQQYTKLHVYKGPNHPHHAQQPTVYTLGGF